jgi:hypothetical protein
MRKEKDAITVTIGIYSGRPNPELSLTGEAGEELAKLLKTAVGQEPIHPPPAARLGHYYGFRVQLAEDLASRFDLPTEFSIYHGVVTEQRGRAQSHWRDVAKVEEFLIGKAYEEGHGDLLKKAGAERPR